VSLASSRRADERGEKRRVVPGVDDDRRPEADRDKAQRRHHGEDLPLVSDVDRPDRGVCRTRRAYQLYVATEKQLAPASIIVAVAALRFLYTVTLRKAWAVEAVIPAPKVLDRLPVVLSPTEVVQFFACVQALKHRTILTACYAAGLRISEAVRLTPPAIDSQRMVLRIEQGKGQKDRYVMLSPTLLEILRDWWRVSRSRPWLFPGDHPGQPITTRAVNRACRKTHRRCRIPKPIIPHPPRHAFAVHLLEAGTNVRTIQ